ncbi:MAG: phosphatidylserine decarboxylase proenzyme [Phycisphaerae bacterium]|jgi:phosphatidylserine decarboxylase|nr:MAG: phosphatidylserine decarboxylase proenzyme [Phycisphaerae bacterium]
MFRFTKHGFWEMVLGTIGLTLIGVGLALIHWGLVLIPFLIWVWLMAFFRDPQRNIPGQPNDWVSPADGLVSDITEIPHDELLGGPAIRIGIFLSVFNVHVNRAPCDAVVLKTIYKKGKFINALHHNHASSQNESNTILLGDTSGRPIAVVKQIVGLIARRIICTAAEGTSLTKGQRIGMIKFGSRTELLVSKGLNPTVHVRTGQKVRGGADILLTVDRIGSEPSRPVNL